MRVYVEPSGRRVLPFDDPPGELRVGNRTLAQWQNDMIDGAKLTRIDTLTPPCLVIPDTLFSTATNLRRFVEQADGKDAVLVVAESRFGRDTTPVQPHVVAVEKGWRFESVRFVSGSDAPATDIVLDPEESVITIPMPDAMGGPREFSLPRHPLMTVHHWVHVLWANQHAAAMIARQQPAWKMVLRGLWAVIRALSFNKWKVMAKFNTIGKKCDIHPTAVVEASTLGNGVTVGPHARVLFSTVADGATIMTGADVEASTIGEKAIVAQRTGLRLSVLYPDSFASQALMQACILGNRTVTSLGAHTLDMNFEQDVRVMLDGKLHTTGTSILGAAFGHDCRLGTGFYLASGRAIPNGTFMVRQPSGVIQRVPETASDGKPMANVDGTLRPLGDGS